jgi:hypothetical protein
MKAIDILSSVTGGRVTLYHGSALVYTNSIATFGVNLAQLTLANENADKFCTSTSFDIAKGYALLNPLVRMAGDRLLRG